MEQLIDKYKKIAKSKGIAYEVKGGDTSENLDTTQSHHAGSQFTRKNKDAVSSKKPEINI